MTKQDAYELGIKIAMDPLHVVEGVNTALGSVLAAQALAGKNSKGSGAMRGFMGGAIALPYLSRVLGVDDIPTVAKRLKRGLPLLAIPAALGLAGYALGTDDADI